MKKILLILACVLGLAGMGAVIPILSAGADSSASTDDETCVPSEAWTETSDWVLASPGEGWYQTDQRTVVDQAAYDEVVEEAHWQRYSWTGGPRESDDPPPFPSDEWQPNVQGDPHGIGVEGAYFISHGNSGNGDWFYLEWVEAVTVHHEAVTHEEFKFAFDHPAVTCPTDPTDPPTTDDPTDDPTDPTDPPTTDDPTDPTDPPTTDDPTEPTDPTDPPEADEPGQPRVERYCTGNSLTIKKYDSEGNTVYSGSIAGAPRCAHEPGDPVVKEEGM